ncbi:efflux RND transporter permease subunit [Mesorhizobium sp. YC-39]|uniref:efflux RND transporter permease subunit n=1 Tax=unclassified Mesorhizobium TaxID=325217 RepID=UPI0021E7E1E2|nr:MULTISPECIES: efflux RND transporter permease subunit [unclassified Mesorhizobium]MCV3206511.1 efflux RND transporter permease subunit [Mesorhizobium sp. YC-2]MCV3227089.1 efflux RND transporter permease subunit [Mesorhizobium sp. YC-39]
MGIVRFALRFPHTFYVLAALILFLGAVAGREMRLDVFPEINIPVVTVIWSYGGLSTPEMEQRVTTYSQYAISSNVNGIKNIEAQTLGGLSVQKIYFQQDVNLDLAIAQIVSATNAIRALLPPGIQAPLVVQFNASSVPVLQISLSSDTLNEQQLYDYGIYRIRQQLAPIPGVTLPTPAGGKYRQIMVDLDPSKLLAKGLTPLDVVSAVNAQNLTLPSGTAKIGNTQYVVHTNATPATIDELNNIPVKVVNGATVFVKDVGQVHDGWLVQQNIVRENGRHSVLLSIIKNGNASTLEVVDAVRDALKTARAAAPPGMEIKELFDQSVFVKQSIAGVLREGVIAAALTALMILLFLGSWRSTLVVMISIPLAILSSVVALYFLGETLNTMTLGGLALAIGILVDDSTVTLENTHRLLTEEGQMLPQATLHGAAGIAVPTLVSTLAISCVFTSVVFLEGPAKYLFTPLGLAVVFAMLASYGLSRTLTPITIGLLLKSERHDASTGWFGRFHTRFEHGFEAMRLHYAELLAVLLRHRFIVPVIAALVLALGTLLSTLVGRDFFPAIDGGQIQLHVRAPAGTRIEETEKIFQAVEDKIREIVPDRDLQLVVDNIGLPARAYNLAFTDGSTIGVNDGVILVSLKDGHAPTADYVRKLRAALPSAFPDVLFYFQSADIVTQILNFGLPAQIDVRTVGYDRATNLRIAMELRRRIAAIPGVVDAHLQQEVDAPAFYADIDRTRAAQLGLDASTIANNINVSLSSSEQVSPNFWTDPTTGIPYYLAVQTPENKIASLNDLGNTPVSSTINTAGAQVPGQLSNVATFKRDSLPTNANQANVQPVYEVYASVQGRDLGSVSSQISAVVADLQKQLSPGNNIQVLGQIQSMNDAFWDLGIGILFAAVFVYLLMVVNYQNFGDPFVVILALPATLCGIVTMLFITGTTLNVPSLMGAIMAVGVASANSILLVTFARDQQLAGKSAFDAAIEAGHTRIRPVLMTAAAMIVGMVPMAIGGAGEEQNAALARAVIGGLLFATPTTLLVVPYLFAMLRSGQDGKTAHGVFDEEIA